MKQHISRFMTAVLLIGLILVSCGEGEPVETDAVVSQSETTTEPTVEDMLASLPDEDFGEYEFTFLTISSGINSTTRFTDEIFVEEEDGDIINDSVYQRNQLVNEKYNVTIAAMPEELPSDVARAAILAGDNIFDVMNLYKSESIVLLPDGLLADWNDLPYCDYTAPWWNRHCIEKLTIGDMLPFMSGSILISEIDDTLAMVYNKALADEYNISGLYDVVRDGKWTIDYMTSLIKQISRDLNGDSQYVVGDDLFGYVQDPASMTTNWSFACDLMTGYIDSDGKWQPNVDVERAQNLCDKMAAIFAGGTFAYTGTDLYDGLNYFEENKIFLYAIILRNVELLREMNVDFGILPYPKLDENQSEYSTHIGNSSPILTLPITNNDFERTSLILEAMAITSYNIVRPAYYDVALKVKMSRDEDSADMLDIILDSSTYDLSYFTFNAISSILNPLISVGNTNFSSAYASQSNTINQNMQNFIDSVLES